MSANRARKFVTSLCTFLKLLAQIFEHASGFMVTDTGSSINRISPSINSINSINSISPCIDKRNLCMLYKY